jgi:hypothetical protein
MGDTTTTTSAPPASIYPVVPVRDVQPGEYGYGGPDNPGSTNLSPADYARFYGGMAPPAAGAQPQPGDPAIPVSGGSPTERRDGSGLGLSSAAAAEVHSSDAGLFDAPAPAGHPSDAGLFTAPADTSVPVDTRKTGYVTNLAAGGNAQIAGALGLPVDLATGAINLGIRGVNAGARALGVGPGQTLGGLVTGEQPPDLLPPITDPVGGSGTFKRAMGVIDANPDDVRPANIGQEIARGIGGGIVSAMIPGGVVPGLVRAGAIESATAPAVLEALGGLTPKNALLGGTSGGASEAAASAVRDKWKPLAGLAGGLAGVGVPVAAVTGARAATRGALDYAAPAFGKVNPILDASGEAPTMADGTPINMLTPDPETGISKPLAATRRQVRMAGQKLRSLSSNPDAVEAALADQGPPVLPGNPTTAQLTGDPKLLAAERGISRVLPDAQGQFLEQASRENDTRVGLLRGIASDADPAALSAAVQGQAADEVAAHAARITQAQGQAAGDVERVRGAGEAWVGAVQTATELARANREAESQARIDELQRTIDQARAQMEAEAQARIAGHQSSADRARGAIGGDLPAGSDAEVGSRLRAPVVAESEAAREARGALYNAVDPGEKLALGMSPIRAGGASIVREMSVNDAGMGAKEAAIFDKVARLPDVQKFRDLRALRTSITDQIRTERGPAGDPQAVRRLSMLLGHVEGVMNDTIGGAEIAPAAVAPVRRPVETGPGKAPAVGTTAYTPSGVPVDVRYRLREASNLIPSQLPGGRDNPAFPQELQPRDRTRAASELQVNSIASKLIPERLGASASTAEGAPIIGPDGLVESGNGRTMALQQAYAEGGPQAAAYRQWLESQGHDISGMKEPVLVRERVPPADETPASRAKLVKDMGASPVASMSAGERAVGDAAHLTDATLQSLGPGKVTDPGNADFVRSFLRDAVESGGEGAFVTADGSLSKEGAARVEAALVSRAYGDKGLSAALTETTDPTARVLAGSMRDAAGPMARLRAAIDAGVVDPAVDLAPALVEATQMVQQARQRRISLADAVAQSDAFSRISPEALDVLRAAYGDSLSGRMSQSEMTEYLSMYAEIAEKQLTTAGLFGANLSSEQILHQVSSRYGKDAAAGQARYEPADAADLGASNADRGNQERESGRSASGQAAPGAGGGGGGQPGRILPPESQLTPNLDAEAVARLRAANAQNVADKARFNNAPGVGQILQGGPTKGTFRTPESGVPNIIVKVGPAGADVAKAYLAAGGSPEALSDAAAYSLRQYAGRADGSLDPKDVARWVDGRAGFLSVIPDIRAKFAAVADSQRALEAAQAAEGEALKAGSKADALRLKTAAAAEGQGLKAGAASDTQTLKAATQEAAAALKQATAAAEQTVSDAMAARATAVKARQASVLGRFLPGSDPVAVVGSILRDATMGRANMAQLVAAVRGNPDALAGLQRAVADHMTSALMGNKTGAGGIERTLKGDQVQSFLRLREPALQEVMTPQQMTSLRNVAASLERSDRSVSASKMAGGSDSLQIAAAGSASAPTTFLGSLKHSAISKAGTGLGGVFGFLFGGPIGAVAGAAAGGAGDMVVKAVQAAHEAGIRTVEDLVGNAILHPQVYAVLAASVTAENRASLGRALISQLRRISLVSSAVGYEDEGVHQPPRNALLH